LELKNLKFTEK